MMVAFVSFWAEKKGFPFAPSLTEWAAAQIMKCKRVCACTSKLHEIAPRWLVFWRA